MSRLLADHGDAFLGGLLGGVIVAGIAWGAWRLSGTRHARRKRSAIAREVRQLRRSHR